MAKKGALKGGKSPIVLIQTRNTPLGRLWLAVSERGLICVAWGLSRQQFEEMVGRRWGWQIKDDGVSMRRIASQIEEYLAGERQVFDLPIDWEHFRPFQRLVLQATCAIPYGETRSYGELAARLGRPRAARAVGRALACNPLPLVIPCHRVIGRDGKLHGYGMGEGLKTKEWLLKLEGAVIA